MPVYRATDADGQVLYEDSPEALGERTGQLGSKFTLWDVVQLSDDREHAPAYVGYMVGGQLMRADLEVAEDAERQPGEPLWQYSRRAGQDLQATAETSGYVRISAPCGVDQTVHERATDWITDRHAHAHQKG